MNTGIKARPTEYSGIHFRSRLEAVWASFFDEMGWVWEYEPDVGGAYIPDFLLHGTGDRRVYVEVKPYLVYSDNREEIILKAAKVLGYNVDLLVLTDEFPSGDLGDFIFGFMPLARDDWEETGTGLERVGGLCVPHDEWAVLSKAWKGESYDFHHTWGSWELRLSGLYDGDAFVNPVSKTDFLKLWSRARNRIQWMPR